MNAMRMMTASFIDGSEVGDEKSIAMGWRCIVFPEGRIYGNELGAWATTSISFGNEAVGRVTNPARKPELDGLWACTILWFARQMTPITNGPGRL